MDADDADARLQIFSEALPRIEQAIREAVADIPRAETWGRVAALCHDFNEMHMAHEDIQVYANRLKRRRTSASFYGAGSDHGGG